MPDAELDFFEDFFTPAESDRLFTGLLDSIAWQQEHISLYGKTHLVPRLTAWYGDAGCCYTYSGIRRYPARWIPLLLTIRNRIERVTEVHFNGVLLNLYRDGRDSMGWHSDAERELGENPMIASVSFGGPRRFLLRHKNGTHNSAVTLTHGSLLLMGGATQHYWQHRIPKTRQAVPPRINLTFRVIR
ncbi:MAG: alpha-ketoglutarate-dependent dioxygenase AlkB [Candidatus Competibacteraceae bacterium]|nr:alpha-ketoglutarate-dependent dioxygenase AlkB [Candidatus Competibacteraceae bacterium]